MPRATQPLDYDASAYVVHANRWVLFIVSVVMLFLCFIAAPAFFIHDYQVGAIGLLGMLIRMLAIALTGLFTIWMGWQ